MRETIWGKMAYIYTSIANSGHEYIYELTLFELKPLQDVISTIQPDI